MTAAADGEDGDGSNDSRGVYPVLRARRGRVLDKSTSSTCLA